MFPPQSRRPEVVSGSIPIGSPFPLTPPHMHSPPHLQPRPCYVDMNATPRPPSHIARGPPHASIPAPPSQASPNVIFKRPTRAVCTEYFQGRCPNREQCPLVHPPAENIIRVVDKLVTMRRIDPRSNIIWLRNGGRNDVQASKRYDRQSECCLDFLSGRCDNPMRCPRLHIRVEDFVHVLQMNVQPPQSVDPSESIPRAYRKLQVSGAGPPFIRPQSSQNERLVGTAQPSSTPTRLSDIPVQIVTGDEYLGGEGVRHGQTVSSNASEICGSRHEGPPLPSVYDQDSHSSSDLSMVDTESSFSDKSSDRSPDVSDDTRITPLPDDRRHQHGMFGSRDGRQARLGAGSPAVTVTLQSRSDSASKACSARPAVASEPSNAISISSRNSSDLFVEPASKCFTNGNTWRPIVNLPPGVCYDWARGCCLRDRCRFEHIPRPNVERFKPSDTPISSKTSGTQMRDRQASEEDSREVRKVESVLSPVDTTNANSPAIPRRNGPHVVQRHPRYLSRGFCFEWICQKTCSRCSCPYKHEMPPPTVPETGMVTAPVSSPPVACAVSSNQIADPTKLVEAPTPANPTEHLNHCTTTSAPLYEVVNKSTQAVKSGPPATKPTSRTAKSSSLRATKPDVPSTGQAKEYPVTKLMNHATHSAKSESSPAMPKRQPPQEQTLVVVDPIRVTFGSGFSVNKVVTASESLWITIANVPRDTNRGALERLLAPFGHVADLRFPQNKRTDEVTITISAQMSSYPEAVAAVEALDETTVFGSKITVRPSLGKTAAMQRVHDGDIRISWAVPSRNGYAGYETLKAAQKAVAAADGSILRGHWVTATMYDGLPVIGQYNVRFHGLPHDAQVKNIKKFGQPQDTMLERPNYSAPDFGIPAVEAIMRECGSTVYFDTLPPPYKDGIVRAWCRFESPDVASFACEKSGIKQRALSGEQIWVQRVHSVRRVVDRSVYEVIRLEIARLRNSLSQFSRGTTLTVFDKELALDTVSIKLVAEESKTLAEVKARLTELIRGELVTEGGRQVWDDFFSHPIGQEFVNDLHISNPDVLVRIDRNRRTIRVIGEREKRKVVVASVLSKISFRRSQRIHTVPLQGGLIGLFMSADLMAVQRKHGPENVWLDLMKRMLCVRGSEEVYEEVQHIVHRAQDRHPSERSRDRCPVCFEDPTTPTMLSCGHVWCKSCLTGYLTAATDTRQFPLSCLGDEASCKECIPLSVARTVLSPSGFEALTLAAFHAHVHARPEEFYYCPTPDCPQVYRPGPRDSVYNCPTCLCRICPHCHVEYHEGVTCADREDGFDRLFDQWASAHDVKKCPGCKAPIERAEGCNHMTCTRCHTHTCWVCLETFPKGQGIYDHMRQEHGSIGL